MLCSKGGLHRIRVSKLRNYLNNDMTNKIPNYESTTKFGNIINMIFIFCSMIAVNICIMHYVINLP